MASIRVKPLPAERPRLLKRSEPTTRLLVLCGGETRAYWAEMPRSEVAAHVDGRARRLPESEPSPMLWAVVAGCVGDLGFLLGGYGVATGTLPGLMPFEIVFVTLVAQVVGGIMASLGGLIALLRQKPEVWVVRALRDPVTKKRTITPVHFSHNQIEEWSQASRRLKEQQQIVAAASNGHRGNGRGAVAVASGMAAEAHIFSARAAFDMGKGIEETTRRRFMAKASWWRKAQTFALVGMALALVVITVITLVALQGD